MPVVKTRLLGRCRRSGQLLLPSCDISLFKLFIVFYLLNYASCMKLLGAGKLGGSDIPDRDFPVEGLLSLFEHSESESGKGNVAYQYDIKSPAPKVSSPQFTKRSGVTNLQPYVHKQEFQNDDDSYKVVMMNWWGGQDGKLPGQGLGGSLPAPAPRPPISPGTVPGSPSPGSPGSPGSSSFPESPTAAQLNESGRGGKYGKRYRKGKKLKHLLNQGIYPPHYQDNLDYLDYYEQSPLGEIISNIFPNISIRTIEYFISFIDMVALFYYNWRILTTIKF